MPAPADDTPAYLLEPPDGKPPPPPVDSAEPLLPFDQLTWENFERLCVRLVKHDAPDCHAQPFGTKGQNQSGIDIYRRLQSGRYSTYQCRRVASMSPGAIKQAVDDFLAGEWSRKSDSFTLCTSKSTVKTQYAKAVETQAARLKARASPIEFAVWDAEVLSARLKDLPSLVVEFFSRPWLERFAPQHAMGSGSDAFLSEGRDLISGIDQTPGRVRVVILDWAPERLQKALTRLHEDDPERFERLTENVPNPPQREHLAVLIAAPPVWAREGDDMFWELLARMSESVGEWSAAGDAWEQAAARRDADGAVRSLMSAAAAAAVGGDTARRDALVARASDIDPNHPRVLLEALDDQEPAPTQQLIELERLRGLAEHADDRLLIIGRLALGRLVIPDVEGARELLPELDQLGKGSALARAVRLNVTVQQGRLDTLAARPLDFPALRDAHQAALDLRGRLVLERRWEESARVLMLAVDALCLIGERSSAASLLRGALPEELESPTGAEVLADAAASRVLDFRLALDLLDGRTDGPGVRRIRAEALEAVGTPDERRQALAELDALVDDGGPEAPEAAFIRLVAALGERRTEWSEPAAELLTKTGHGRAAITARAFYVARPEQGGFDEAEAVLAPHIEEPWAKVARLRLSTTSGKHSVIRAAADDVVSFAPGPGALVEAAQGYAIVGDFPKAKQVLMGVARRPTDPPAIRGESYRLLMRVVGTELNDWKLAATLYDEWQKLTPTDPRVSAWGPMISNRRPRSADG